MPEPTILTQLEKTLDTFKLDLKADLKAELTHLKADLAADLKAEFKDLKAEQGRVLGLVREDIVRLRCQPPRLLSTVKARTSHQSRASSLSCCKH